MKRAHRLRRPAEFERVRQLAPRGFAHPMVVLYLAPNDLDVTRIGITVSRRVGNAVTRNRVRRRLREALRLRLAELPAATDIVVVARPASATASWAELNVALESTLARVAGAPR